MLLWRAAALGLCLSPLSRSLVGARCGVRRPGLLAWAGPCSCRLVWLFAPFSAAAVAVFVRGLAGACGSRGALSSSRCAFGFFLRAVT